MVGFTEWLTRAEAATYLTSIGVPIKERTLAKLAEDENSGKGPAYTRSGWRTVRYEKTDLDVWAKGRKRKILVPT